MDAASSEAASLLLQGEGPRCVVRCIHNPSYRTAMTLYSCCSNTGLTPWHTTHYARHSGSQERTVFTTSMAPGTKQRIPQAAIWTVMQPLLPMIASEIRFAMTLLGFFHDAAL